MIRFHLVRQVQTSHCDIEARCVSVDGDLARLEELLTTDLKDSGSMGSNWTFVGLEILPAQEVPRG
jgi:hypothetical protein